MSEDNTKVFSNGDDKLDHIIEMLRQQFLRTEVMESRLTSLETIVNERLKDTRPLWEGVQMRLDQLEQNLGDKITEVEKSLRRLDRRIMTLADDMVKLRADQRDIEDRVDKIEQKPS